MTKPEHEICGDTSEHDLFPLGEDEDEGAWECRRCGAEIYEEDSDD